MVQDDGQGRSGREIGEALDADPVGLADLVVVGRVDEGQRQHALLLEVRFVDAGEGAMPLSIELAKRAGRRERYSESETIAILQRNLEVEALQEAGLINITYYSDDPAEAKTVADTVAAAYISFLEEDNARRIEGLIGVGIEYRKAREGFQSVECASDLRNRLLDI